MFKPIFFYQTPRRVTYNLKMLLSTSLSQHTIIEIECFLGSEINRLVFDKIKTNKGVKNKQKITLLSSTFLLFAISGFFKRSDGAAGAGDERLMLLLVI